MCTETRLLVFIMSPIEVEGDIVFGADPVGVYTISHEPVGGFNQICMDIKLGHDEELIIFNVTVGFFAKFKPKKCLSAYYLMTIIGMLQNLHVYIIGTGSIADSIWVTLT